MVTVMARVNAQEFAEKWSRRTAAATGDYTRGVQRVREAPGAKAAAKVDKYLAGVQASVQEGKWQARVGRVSLSEWQRAATEKGAGRISAGVQSATGDMQRFGQELLSHIDSVKNETDNMPDNTLEDRIQRMVSFSRGMSQFRRS